MKRALLLLLIASIALALGYHLGRSSALRDKSGRIVIEFDEIGNPIEARSTSRFKWVRLTTNVQTGEVKVNFGQIGRDVPPL